MKVTLTLSANAGVAISVENQCIWVDVLHRHNVAGFSSVNDALFQKVLSGKDFPQPDLICYTHCHEDHFSAEMTSAAIETFPNAAAVLPENRLNRQILLTGDRYVHSCGDLKLEFCRLTHAGEQYRDTAHYGIIITVGDRTILVGGDCEVASDTLTGAVNGRKVYLAILPFPWLSLKKGRAFLENQLAPGAIVLYHLPFEDDDAFGYRSAAQKAVKAWNSCPAYLLQKPLQQLELEI